MRALRIVALLIAGFLLIAPAACGGGTALSAQDAALLQVLQQDDTDANPYVEGTYEAEHYARDLEDVLEGRGYDVRFLVALQYAGELAWQPLLKVIHTGGNVSLVDAQQDAIVTAAYDGDGDGDGTVQTLVNQSFEDKWDALESLFATGSGNDGPYLIFEFRDYDTVLLVDTPAGDEKTLDDLRNALREDNTDKGKYVAHLHDCDDFARELEAALEAKGFRVTVKVVYWMDGGEEKGHVINDVYTSDGDTAVEPQNDEFVTGKYDDDGDGAIGRYISPSAIQRQIWFTLWKKGWKSGSDGKYWIEEYENFKDIPYPLDPMRYELTTDFPTVQAGGSTTITLDFSAGGSDLNGNIDCEGGYLEPADDTGLHYIWHAENELGLPLEPGTYIITSSFWDMWDRGASCSETIEVIAPPGGWDVGPDATCPITGQ